MNLAKSIVNALARHFINATGAALVAEGVLTSDQSASIAGGLMTALAVGWSLYDKSRTAQRLQPLQQLKGLF